MASYDPRLLEAAQDPIQREEMLAQLARRMVAAGGLSAFIRLAWQHTAHGADALKWNWHLDCMSELLQAVSYGQIRNLLINIPPGCMKSLEVSTYYPAWDWIDNPKRKFLAATYAQDLSNKNAKLHRDLVLSDWYQKRWGPRPEEGHVGTSIGKEESKSIKEFSNTQGGYRFSTSVKGGATGRHVDVIICDDLVKAQDADGKAIVTMTEIRKAVDFRFNTLMTRRADPEKTAFITIMQRLHYGDPAQRCIDQGDHTCLILPMEFDPARKCFVDVPAFEDKPRIQMEDPRKEAGELLWPGRFSQETVEELKVALGPIQSANQLDQNPSPATGNMFERDWFLGKKSYQDLPAGGRMIITVDCSFKDASTSDFVSIQTWLTHKNSFYLVSRQTGQWGIKKTCLEILRAKIQNPRAKGVYIEAAANGFATEQILRDKITGLKLWKPGKASKEERAESVSEIVEVNSYFPADAPWLGPYITQLTQFPRGVNDDDVDATTMALLILHKTVNRRQKQAYKNMMKGGVLT